MSTNVIKQTLVGEPGMQTIKQIVRSNERGPQGPKGDPGPQGPQGLPGERGADGAIQYRAGTGINISDENIISATGEATSVWGGIEGDIADQTDLAPYIKSIAPERIWYGVCNTAAGQTQKVVTTTAGGFSFNEGDALVVFFNYAHTKSNYTPQLVVDGGTPTPVFFTSDWQEATNTYWANAEPVMFVYHQYYGINRFYAIGKAHASTTITGAVRLYNDVDSTSTIMAPTANALKTTYDAIDTKIATALAGTGYVGTTNIADAAVTAAKIASNAITTAKILDGAVTPNKLDLDSIIVFGPGIENVTLSGATEIANVTVPENGTYVVLGIGAISGGSGDFVTWELYKNSTVIAQTYADPGVRPSATMITSATLTKDDNILMKCTFDGGKTLTRPNGILLLRIS